MVKYTPQSVQLQSTFKPVQDRHGQKSSGSGRKDRQKSSSDGRKDRQNSSGDGDNRNSKVVPIPPGNACNEVARRDTREKAKTKREVLCSLSE